LIHTNAICHVVLLVVLFRKLWSCCCSLEHDALVIACGDSIVCIVGVVRQKKSKSGVAEERLMATTRQGTRSLALLRARGFATNEV
jgi:hypothetical protein